jgi:L-rhamnose mutarotase
MIAIAVIESLTVGIFPIGMGAAAFVKVHRNAQRQAAQERKTPERQLFNANALARYSIHARLEAEAEFKNWGVNQAAKMMSASEQDEKHRWFKQRADRDITKKSQELNGSTEPKQTIQQLNADTGVEATIAREGWDRLADGTRWKDLCQALISGDSDKLMVVYQEAADWAEKRLNRDQKGLDAAEADGYGLGADLVKRATRSHIVLPASEQASHDHAYSAYDPGCEACTVERATSAKLATYAETVERANAEIEASFGYPPVKMSNLAAYKAEAKAAFVGRDPEPCAHRNVVHYKRKHECKDCGMEWASALATLQASALAALDKHQGQ